MRSRHRPDGSKRSVKLRSTGSTGGGVAEGPLVKDEARSRHIESALDDRGVGERGQRGERSAGDKGVEFHCFSPSVEIGRFRRPRAKLTPGHNQCQARDAKSPSRPRRIQSKPWTARASRQPSRAGLRRALRRLDEPLRLSPDCDALARGLGREDFARRGVDLDQAGPHPGGLGGSPGARGMASRDGPGRNRPTSASRPSAVRRLAKRTPRRCASTCGRRKASRRRRNCARPARACPNRPPRRHRESQRRKPANAPSYSEAPALRGPFRPTCGRGRRRANPCRPVRSQAKAAAPRQSWICGGRSPR